MVLARVKPAGWALNELLSSAHLNQLDINMTKAVDGEGGGGYTPAADIVLNGTKTLKLGGTQIILLGARLVTRRQSLRPVILDTTKWHVDNAHTVVNDAISTTTLLIGLDRLPDGGELREIYLRWKGAAGHGALPTLPTFTAYRTNQDGTRTSLGTGTDASGTVGAYEAAHDIALTGLSHTIDLSGAGAANHYFIEVASEQGGNFVANARALSLRAVVNCVSIPEY